MLKNDKQRATKVEREAAEAVLRNLFQQAFNLGEVILDYSTEGKEGFYKARILHQALSDYRKKIRRKQTEMFDLWLQIDCIEIRLREKIRVELIKKPGAVSERTQVILNVAQNNPNLGLLSRPGETVAPHNGNFAGHVAKIFEEI